MLNYIIQNEKRLEVLNKTKLSILINLEKVISNNDLIVKDWANQINISRTNLSKIKQGKSKLIRFSTLDSLCEVLKCQPGNLIEYVKK